MRQSPIFRNGLAPFLALLLAVGLLFTACGQENGQDQSSETATKSGPTSAEPELSATLQALLDSAYTEDGPGAAVVVSRKGEILLSATAGLADLEMGVPLNEDHIFRLASVSKQYTAAAILKLVEEGKLALDDPLERLLPDFPIGEVTVHQLLNHTSGIRSYTDIPGYFGGELIRRDLSTQELIAVFADEPADFEPGEKWHYNNSAYVLLGAIIEEISGQSWDAYIVENLLVPAGIKQTAYYPDEMVLPGRVRGYQMEGSPKNAPWLSMTQPHAAGALSATALDVDRWQRALHGGEILSPAMLEKMTEADDIARNLPGMGGDYGYGVMMGTARNRPAIHHGGGIPGFATMALWLPEEEISVVVLSNAVGHQSDPGTIAFRLAALAIGDPYPADLPTVELSENKLADLQGSYRIDEDTIRTLTLEDGKLLSQRQSGSKFEVRPVGDDRFALANSLSYFTAERDSDGRVIGVNFYQQGQGDPEHAEKFSDSVEVRQEVSLSLPEMERLVGDYEIQPGFVLNIRIEDGALLGQATGQPAVELKSAATDRLFNEQFGLELHFTLDADGPAESLTLHQGGQSIPASRVKQIDENDGYL